MARVFSTLGVFNDLFLGNGRVINANFVWQGDDSGVATTTSVAYAPGSLVTDSGRLYVNSGAIAIDNLRPGATPAGGSVNPWVEISQDVQGAMDYAPNTAYLAGNLVYHTDSNGDELLYAVTADIDDTNTADSPAGVAGFVQVGGGAARIGARREARSEGNGFPVGPLVNADTGGGAFRRTLTFLGANAVTNADEFSRAMVGRVLNDAELYTFLEGETSQLRSAEVGGTALLSEFTAGTGVNITDITRENDTSFTWPSDPGDAVSQPLNDGIFVVWTSEVTDPVLLQGEGISIDYLSDSTLRISVETDGLGAIRYNSTSGEFSLDTDSSLIQDGDRLVVQRADDSLTDAGNGILVRLDANTGNDLELVDGEGLRVNEHNITAAESATGVDTDPTIRLQGGVDTDSTVQLIAADQTPTALGTEGSLTITRNGDDSITFTSPLVASWAQNDTTGVTIPLSKLPNIELGNTYTFETPAGETPVPGNVLRDIIENIGGQTSDDNAPIEWHTGDLLVIAGTTPDAADDGIYVFTAPSSVGPTDFGVVDPQGGDIALVRDAFSANFRGVITATGDVNAVSFTNIDSNGQAFADQNLNSITYNADEDVIEFGASGQSTVSVAQVERVEDNEAFTQYINRVKIGGVIYQFGPTPALPFLRFSPTARSLNAFSDTDQSTTFALQARQLFRNEDGTDTEQNATISGGQVYTSTETNGFVANTAAILIAGDTTNTLTVSADNPQPIGARVNVVGDAIVTDVNLGNEVAADQVADAIGTLTFTDGRSNPRITRSATGPRFGTSIANLDGDLPLLTIDFTPTGSIAIGEAYDTASYQVNGGASFQRNAPTFQVPEPTDFDGDTFVFSYQSPLVRSFGQTGTPSNNTQSVNYFTPWFYDTVAPTGGAVFGDIPADTTNANRLNSPFVTVPASASAFNIVGNENDTVYFLVPVEITGNISITPVDTNSGLPLSPPVPGAIVSPTPVLVPTIITGTSQGYNVWLFAGLDANNRNFAITLS